MRARSDWLQREGERRKKNIYRRGKNESPVVRKRERCCGYCKYLGI